MTRVLLIIVFSIVIQVHPGVVWGARLCTGDAVPCTVNQLLYLAQHHSATLASWSEALWWQAQHGGLPYDPRLLSPAWHEAGMIIADQTDDLNTYQMWCGQHWRGACFHGVIMERIDEGKTVTCTGLPDWAYLNCVHALGHSFTVYSTDMLNNTLVQCQQFSGAAVWACSSGVFMEYSAVGTSGSGHHSETPAGTFVLPCADLDTIWQQNCSASNGAYRQYQPGRESFNATAVFCQTQPDPAACLGGMELYQDLALAQ